jgi:hypothetical protein
LASDTEQRKQRNQCAQVLRRSSDWLKNRQATGWSKGGG